MMTAKKYILLFLMFSLCSSATAGDIYLLDIKSQSDFEIVAENISHAHGLFDGRFLVSLEKGDVSLLTKAGIDLERIAPGGDLDNYYILSPVMPREYLKSLSIDYIYSSGLYHLASPGFNQLDQIRQAGYKVIPVGQKETPFFYTPKYNPVTDKGFYPSDTIADLVSQDSLYDYVTTLEAFQTRYIYSTSIHDARDWLVGKFDAFGYMDVSFDTFSYSGQDCHNVICVKPGSAEPDKLIVIGGHYDSINSQSDPNVYAPGADDNGSGTAVVLEMARIFKDVDTRKTIVFCAFSAEEVGLVGSEYIANRMYSEGADIEVMLNFDMVAFNESGFDEIKFFYGPFSGYARALAEATIRVTDLDTNFAGVAGNSDHASFVNYGYHAAYTQEGEFNYGGWHTNLDISSRLDFPYFEKVVRMAAAGVGAIDRAAAPTNIDKVYDAGNGQDLLVTWNECRPDYTYMVLYGTSAGIYTDTADVASGNCDYMLTGLVESQEYHITVMGINSEGYGPLFLDEVTATPLVMPRKPVGLTTEPEYFQISLAWYDNAELDLDHYRILRRTIVDDWAIIEDNCTDTIYTDTDVISRAEFEYRIQAVDADMNISDSSLSATAVPATFEEGVLLIDETVPGGVNPTEEQQDAFYDSIFAGWQYFSDELSNPIERLDRSIAGQYGSLFWFDDDVNNHDLHRSLDSLQWYLNFETNFVLAGWKAVTLEGYDPLFPGDFVYDNFQIQRVSIQSTFDFIGATGVNGWPDLELKTDNPFNGELPYMTAFEPAPGATPIASFNSKSSDPDFDGKPCGVIYDTGSGKRVALGFPVYYLTEASGSALISRIMEYFDEQQSTYGDVDDNGLVNLSDILYLINYLYVSGPPPMIMNNADVNGDCIINLSDILDLISYKYLEGSPPVEGCVE